MPAGTDWDDHLIARFTALHKDGKRKFSQIADILNYEFGLQLTKNACIGKARRLGFKERPHVAPPLPRKGQNRKKRPTPLPVEVIAPVLPGWQIEPPILADTSGHITIYQLKEGVCHFPFGERAPYAYCGSTTRRGLSWCPHHEHVVYPRGTMR
jgi:hypothetical protein